MTSAVSTRESVPPKTHATRPRRRPITAGQVLNYFFVFLILVLYLFPLGFLVNTALKSNAEFFADPAGLATSLRFGNFVTAWQKGQFGAYFVNSVEYTTAAATLSTVVSVLVGYPVSRGYVKYPRVWYGIFVAMLFLPNALMTQFQLVLRLNLYDTALGYILMVASGLGVGPLIISGYVKSVPKEMDEAAAIDGVGYWRFVFRILPPLIKPALATVFIYQAIGAWNDIILATILLPDQSKSPLTLGLFAFQGAHSSQWSLLAAATMIVATPLMAAYIFLQRFLVGSVVGAVKG